MGTAIAKQDRIGARVPHEVYQTLCRAASPEYVWVGWLSIEADSGSDCSHPPWICHQSVEGIKETALQALA